MYGLPVIVTENGLLRTTEFTLAEIETVLDASVTVAGWLTVAPA